MAKDAGAYMKEETLEEDLPGQGSGPRVYELAFHLDPELPTEEVKKAYTRVKGAIEANGSIVAEGEPEKIQLAYTISRQEPSGRRDFDSAYFAWIVYECDSSKHATIMASVKAETHIVRSLDILTTKDAARHAQEMKELSTKTPPAKEGEPTVSDAELDAALEEVAV